MSRSNPTVLAGRIEELQRENAALQEQLRKYAASQAISRGALSEAVTEKETTAKLAHQVVVEERATRAAVEVTASNISFAMVLQVLSFFVLVVLLLGLFLWLPREMENRLARPTTLTAPATGAAIQVR